MELLQTFVTGLVDGGIAVTIYVGGAYILSHFWPFNQL